MKGIELPINALIIIAIAVIVLIALVSMFYPAFSSGNLVLTSEGAKTKLCQIMVEAKGCSVESKTVTIDSFDADRDGYVGTVDVTSNWNNWAAPWPTCSTSDAQATWGDNLASLCYCYYSITSEAVCKKMCGC
jgi:hypothetical protein